MNYPLKIYRKPNFVPNGMEIEFEVIRLKDSHDISKIKDEFCGNQEIDMSDMLTSLFKIDARLFKHFRLLQWFPSYMKLFFDS